MPVGDQNNISINRGLIMMESQHALDSVVVLSALEGSDPLQGDVEPLIRSPVNISETSTGNVLCNELHSLDEQRRGDLVASTRKLQQQPMGPTIKGLIVTERSLVHDLT